MVMRFLIPGSLCGLAAVVLLVAGPAAADPCKAIPDKGPMPSWLHHGSVFTGPVRYVGDGDSLCVSVRPGPEGLVEVRLADFYAPELHEPGGEQAREALERVAMGKLAACVAQHRSYDRVVATCMIEGRDVGALMRGTGVREGGRGRPQVGRRMSVDP
jgi:micrococcal nuclease